ncbi:hypothetical protein LZ189_25300, partial [Rhodovulum sulfidophilum]|nr:hypothetical protein [Rhodovulum sulfidophilum]
GDCRPSDCRSSWASRSYLAGFMSCDLSEAGGIAECYRREFRASSFVSLICIKTTAFLMEFLKKTGQIGETPWRNAAKTGSRKA